jgi:hypothetical protein
MASFNHARALSFDTTSLSYPSIFIKYILPIHNFQVTEVLALKEKEEGREDSRVFSSSLIPIFAK